MCFHMSIYIYRKKLIIRETKQEFLKDIEIDPSLLNDIDVYRTRFLICSIFFDKYYVGIDMCFHMSIFILRKKLKIRETKQEFLKDIEIYPSLLNDIDIYRTRF